jgi:hypothetical protein
MLCCVPHQMCDAGVRSRAADLTYLLRQLCGWQPVALRLLQAVSQMGCSSHVSEGTAAAGDCWQVLRRTENGSKVELSSTHLCPCRSRRYTTGLSRLSFSVQTCYCVKSQRCNLGRLCACDTVHCDPPGLNRGDIHRWPRCACMQQQASRCLWRPLAP